LDAEDSQSLYLPQEDKGKVLSDKFKDQATLISNDVHESGVNEETWALEIEEEDIPSLKWLLYEDAKNISDKFISDETGTYLRVKDALKKVMPQQYKWIKELKDVLLDRHSVRDI
jgi:hypothetical protein